MLDVAVSLFENADFFRIHIKSDAMESGIRKRADQRQADVPQADDSDFCRLVGDLPGELGSELLSCHSGHRFCVPGAFGFMGYETVLVLAERIVSDDQ